MAKQVVKARSTYVGSLDLAGSLNQADLNVTAAEVDMTNFASGGNYEGLGGIKKTAINFNGFWDSTGAAGNPNNLLVSQIAAVNPVTLAMAYPATAGDIAYFANGLETQYQVGAMVGEAARISLQMAGNSPTIAGYMLELVTTAATHDSASLTMPAVGATQRLYLAVHVTAASGTSPTLDLVIESDADDTYASATTRITVPQFTAIGYYFTSIAGAITDVEYRVAATVGGTDPSFTYVAALGIL